jgi:hypothetical protein
MVHPATLTRLGALVVAASLLAALFLALAVSARDADARVLRGNNHRSFHQCRIVTMKNGHKTVTHTCGKNPRHVRSIIHQHR